jgi:CHAT domain-containing protein
LKKLVLVVIAVCSLALRCDPQDTKPADEWARPVEPRLTGATGWQPCTLSLQPGRIVAEAQCGPAPVTAPADCDEAVENPAEAPRLLAERPACTDAAIAIMEPAARGDPALMSDLAAAYYVRAQRNDDPSDFLRALKGADQAVQKAPDLATARFNRALTQEALGLSEDAIASWNELLRIERGPWAAEARRHRNALAHELAFDAASQWTRNQRKLPIALQAGDRDAVAKLIEPAPGAAVIYLENELLPQWAADPSAGRLQRARLFAEEVARITRDAYAIDAVQAIERSLSNPAVLHALREGHRAFREGRSAAEAYDFARTAAAYEKADRLLASAGSPVHGVAVLGYAVAISWDDLPRAASLLDRIEQEADRDAHWHLLARIRSTRGYFLYFQSRFVDSIAAYELALADYRKLGDEEGIALTCSRLSGDWRVVGDTAQAWRYAFQAMRYASRISNLKDRHVLLGENALAALALGEPRTALLYQDWAVGLIRRELTSVSPDRLDRISHLKTNLVRAFRERARIRLELNEPEQATRDLDEASRLEEGRTTPSDAKVLGDMQKRTAEVRGRLLLRTNAKAAVQWFTKGIALAAGDELRTFRASLFAQRAEAYRLGNDKEKAKTDLRAALEDLRTEQQRIVHGPLGEGEQLWGSYFSRFQDTYRKLIRQLVEEGRWEEAFSYAEKARAFEPLHRVLQSGFAPPAFRRLIPDGETIDIARLRAALPEGTFLLEYCVVEDRTYVWIVSRRGFEHRTLLRATRGDIQRWTDALQAAARRGDAKAFEGGLNAPYAELIAPALEAIARIPPGQAPRRLVVVPDGAMHGLPVAALRNPETGRYLIEDVTVEFAGSASLYLFSLFRDAALPLRGNPSLLLVGDPAFDAGLPLAREMRRLPGAGREVESIHDESPRAEVLLAEQATVPRFLERAPHHAIVHVAAHAIANQQQPTRSLLLLAPSPGEPGTLDAEELLTRLKLHETRLVVLSTCSSAGGLPVGPEGVAPLVRPFLISGVPAVIGSLWDVNDATAETLLVSFHRNYRQGSDAAEALRAAQVELLRNKNAGHTKPAITWAPFQVIGHASSPFAAPHQQ